jgi:DsbC/DsbD-like thiol-disulfide interchange protein
MESMLFRIFRHTHGALMGCVIFLQPAGPASAPANSPHARVTLISEQTSVQPGSKLLVGLHFELEKGWHIYWINPGDSGQPPRVEWKLPPQFHASTLEWPAPKRLENGPLVDYGYEAEVLLTAAIGTPAHLTPGQKAELQATVKWLVCHDICIPGQQTVALSLPVARATPKHDSPWHALFKGTRDRLPKRVPTAWRVTAVSNPETFVLSIVTGTREAEATFFPLEPLQVRDSAPQRAAPLAQGVRLTLQKSERLLHPIASLKGVLVLRGDQAYSVDVPIGNQTTPGKNLERRRSANEPHSEKHRAAHHAGMCRSCGG